MFSRLTLSGLMLVIGLLVFSPQPAATQSTDATCPAVVEQALAQVGDNCAGLERNAACYGFTQVEAAFAAPAPADFFSRPADRASLNALEWIRTSPLDTVLGEWGIAVVKAQANVPETLPGQAVTFLLLGDTELENAVEPTIGSNEVVTVMAQTSASARREPREDAAVVQDVLAGSVLGVDEMSVDELWLRLRLPGSNAWIPRSTVHETARLDALPVSGQARQNAMQAFYFRNGPGQTSCAQAPSVLAIKSPEGITVDLTMNGAQVKLGSLILLHQLPDAAVMRVTTIEGLAVLEPGTPNEQRVPAGFSTTRCLDTPQNRGVDGEANDFVVGADCNWTEPEPAETGDLEEGRLAQSLYGVLVPDLPTPVPVVSCPAGTTITHVVQPGENLFRLALRYQVRMQAIIDANRLADARSIFAGQSLVIPCGRDSGQPSLPATSTPVTAVGAVDCANFTALAPTGMLSSNSVTFAWTPAAGAAGYRLNIYNQDLRGGVRVATLTTGFGNTSLLVDVSSQTIGDGYKFTWEMQALNGSSEAVCTSARLNFQRGTPPNPPTAAPPSTPETRPTEEPPPPTEELPPPTEETRPTAEVTPPDDRPQETPVTVPTEEPPTSSKPTEEPPPPDQPPSDPNPPEAPPDYPPPTEEAAA